MTDRRYSFPPYPDGWFRVAYSDELARGAVLPLDYFGRELVLYRDEAGAPHLLDAHCPHLGAHLGYGGTVEGTAIRCPFHAWLWDGDGRCIDIPYCDRIPRGAVTRPWTVDERNGLVMAWHHAAGDAPAYELPTLDAVGDDGWTPMEVRKWTVRARWLDMNENCVDMAHFRFVHGTLTIPPTTAEIDGTTHIARSEFRMKMPGGEGDAELVTYDYGPGMQVVRMSGLIDSLMLNTCTPIDEERTDVSFAYTVRACGDDRKKRLAAAVVKDLKNQFEADRPIWENKKYWTRPALCDGDGPLATYRKWLQQFV